MVNCIYFLNLLGNPCKDVGLLKIIYYFKEFISIAFIIIPIIAIIMISLDLMKNVVASDATEQRKNLNLIIKRVIFLAIVFLVPTVVKFFVAFIDDSLGENNQFMACVNVTKDTINKQLSNNKASCTSSGGTWNSKSEMCINKEMVNENAKKLVSEIKSRNSSALEHSKATSLSSGSDGDGVSASSIEEIASSDYPIAVAGLLMALSSKEKAKAPSYGSDLYVYVYDQVYKNDKYRKHDYLYRTGKRKESSAGSTRYRSCSEATVAVVRFSGVDDDFSNNGTAPSNVRSYARSSSRWQQVNWNGDTSKLKPGDVFADQNHAFIYIGKKLLHKYFPKAPANYNIIEANYNHDYNHQAYSLHIDHRDMTSRWYSNGFRCIKPAKKSKYASMKIPSKILK